MQRIELDCIVCPMSCHIEVTRKDQEILSVKGNTCPRGEAFARSEVICPMRMVTTTIRIHQAIHPLLPVITSQNVAKQKIFDIMKICKTLEVKAPVHAGDCLVKDIAGSGADLIASRTMEKRNVYDRSETTSCHSGLEEL